jgi:hypothetical protein
LNFKIRLGKSFSELPSNASGVFGCPHPRLVKSPRFARVVDKTMLAGCGGSEKLLHSPEILKFKMLPLQMFSGESWKKKNRRPCVAGGISAAAGWR